jgi:uncharacterized membrane protein
MFHQFYNHGTLSHYVSEVTKFGNSTLNVGRYSFNQSFTLTLAARAAKIVLFDAVLHQNERITVSNAVSKNILCLNWILVMFRKYVFDDVKKMRLKEMED